MIGYRIRFQNIISELYLPEAANGRVVVFLAGLPSALGKNKLTEQLVHAGYTVFQPFYSGTYDSGGTFSPDQAVKDVTTFVAMAQQTTHRELFFLEQLQVKAEKIFLMGSSFGGGIAASAAAVPGIAGVAVLSPVLTYKPEAVAGFTESVEEFRKQMDRLAAYLVNAYPQSFRLDSESEWGEYFRGDAREKEPFTSLVKTSAATPVLLLHGEDDTTIPITLTKTLVEQSLPKVEFHALPGVGHKVDHFTSPQAWDRLSAFLAS